VLQMIGITDSEIAEKLRIYKEEMANR